ncbi:ketopantoate reductase family protein [Halobacillus amylolyticus]|uniref:2-dehydropantoate 2-reductase n=1 Tax=Halobacillus amylolyticus TaxID=2932259 RepID=A0ABY4HAN5_9BACI|nr:2-dehydropantoate 2-reductase [Halobacillus amylolyticus]UOR11488.1 2-dehydropantoate 2-reductase [Halobacillus amylolyticus]
MNIGVAGAGAVGCYFGGLLKKAGHHVTFLARGSHLTAMKEDGLFIQREQDTIHITNEFTNDPSDLADSDLILFCVKSNDTEGMAQQLRTSLNKHALIVTMQNGVENEEMLKAIFDTDRVLSSATYVQAFVEAPGKIRQQGRVKLVVGELGQSTTSECLAIVEEFQKAGIDTVHSANILERKWHKLLWNATFNPLSAVSSARVGQILDDENLRKTAGTICSEVVEVAVKTGIPLDREATIAKIFSNAELARDHQTSMLQDRLQGKRMEVEAMCGFIVRQSADLDVSAPTLHSIYSILNFFDRKYVEAK